ncbi:hypothetical protein EGP91_01710 [bacterium]|nr:hypothetical protein [bacterium]
MKKIGEYVVYRKEVCEIKDVKENPVNHVMSYKLVPITDKSLTMNIPVDNEFIRDLMTLEDINVLIGQIKDIPILLGEAKQLENEYKRVLNEGTNYGLVQIIKTTYERNQARIKNNKKVSEKDNRYFEMAEKYLYNEMAIVLNMTTEDVRDYVIEQVSK